MARLSSKYTSGFIGFAGPLGWGSALAGMAIMAFPIYVGAVYSDYMEPDLYKVTADIQASTAAVTFATYLLLIGGLMIYMAWEQRRGWKWRFFLFSALPLAVFLAGENIPPLLRLFFFWAIATVAFYQAAVIFCRYHLEEIGD